MFQQRSRYRGFLSLTQVAYMKYCQLTQCWYTLYSIWICTHNIPTCRLLDSWVNTAISKYVTQVWLAWRQAEPFCLIAKLGQSSTKFSLLKLCLTAFRAKSSPRSCLIDWYRCSLLGQPSARVFCFCWTHLTGHDSLDRVWLSRQIHMNTCSPYRSWILP